MLPSYVYKEGEVTIIHIPYESYADMTQLQKDTISQFLSSIDILLPPWEEYDELLEGLILNESFDEKELDGDTHIDSFLEIKEVDINITDALRQSTGIMDLLYCRGYAGMAVLPPLAD